MWRRRRHLSDPELLLLDEGELPPRRQSYGRGHLAVCASCAARRERLNQALAEIGQLHRESREELPVADDVRRRLRTALQEQSSGSPWWRAVVPDQTARGWIGAVTVVAMTLLVLYAMETSSTPRDEATLVPPETGPILPRPDLTPGATRAVSVDEVCGDVPVLAGPRVAPSVPRQVFQAYGADYLRSHDYELDFLITPELGGTTDAENLWPQPFVSTPWNAYVKDELERFLRQRVCEGTLDLKTAQRQMATDWVAAYKRYFNTDRPLRDYRRSPIGANDVEALWSEAAEQRYLPQFPGAVGAEQES